MQGIVKHRLTHLFKDRAWEVIMTTDKKHSLIASDRIEGTAVSRKIALLKRELYRQVKGPEITHADRCTLVFDTDIKSLYVEREVAHLEADIGGTVDYQTATMDIADYLKQGGQTAGHRELWRLLKTLFKESSESDEVIE